MVSNRSKLTRCPDCGEPLGKIFWLCELIGKYYCKACKCWFNKNGYTTKNS